ncbi:hypothetical protein EV426DRAFT_554799 [Tirmania nivea]|nr:hypothetical protein EV426DRAFT_554799 [Tirmania nivea]
MILVMGSRGAGKSHFINTLVGGTVAEVGDGITPCTTTCLLVPTRISKSKVLLIDTPGCEDYNHPEKSVVSGQISRTLAHQYQRGISLRGIVYLQRMPQAQEPHITSPESLLTMFQDICSNSSAFFPNIILTTTGWQLPEFEESVAAVREGELCRSWTQILTHGATMARYYGERDSAVGITSRILGNIDLPHEKEEDLVKRGNEILLARRASLFRDISRLLQQHMVLGEA